MEGVEGVSLTNMAPYSMSMSISMDSLPLLAKQYQIYLYSGDDDFVETMGLELVEGRWFGPEDDAVDFRPAVVNARYARHAYPGEDPLGKEVMPRYRTGSFANRTGKPTRIVGVVNDYRKGGEFDEAEYGMFFRETYRSYDTLATGEDPPRIPSSFVLKVDPSRMSAAFEEEVQAVFAQFMPGWSVYMQPMEQMRADRMRDRLNPLLAFALVALFLVVMVGLGLVGVIGQNVLARTSELGLRRAVGATRGQIFAQVLGELFVLVALAIALGTLVVVQFPLLGAFEGELTWGVFSLGWGAAVVFLLLLAVICGFYPSKNATTVQPTSALQEV
jgi:putative ABC transport system permease protein